MSTSDILTIVLIVVTAVYVWLTNKISNASREAADATKQSVERMKDAHRPILVPRSGASAAEKAVVAAWTSRLLGGDQKHLRLVNAGPGAALNGRIRLQIGYAKDPVPHDVHGYVTEDRTTADPVPPSGEVMVYNYNAGDLIPIPDWSWLTIYYDDVYSRHFITEARWNGTDWVNIKAYETQQEHPYFNPDLPQPLNASM